MTQLQQQGYLAKAVYKDHMVKARKLLKQGADPNLTDIRAFQGACPTTAFWIVSTKGRSIIPDLLRAGLDLGIKNPNGETAAAHLIGLCNPECWDGTPDNLWPPLALLDAGAPNDDPHLLHQLLGRNFPEWALDALIARGVDVAWNPESGVPAFIETAVKNKKWQAVGLILTRDPAYKHVSNPAKVVGELAACRSAPSRAVLKSIIDQACLVNDTALARQGPVRNRI